MRVARVLLAVTAHGRHGRCSGPPVQPARSVMSPNELLCSQANASRFPSGC